MTNVNSIFLTSSDRFWYLKFYVAPGIKSGTLGRWTISLSAVHRIYHTSVRAFIIITKPQRRSLLPHRNPSPSAAAMLSGLEGLPIRFLLETKSRPLRPSRYTIMGREFKRMDKLVAHFPENAESSELQHPYAYFCFSSRSCCSPHDCFTFSDSDYYSQDGTLSVVMLLPIQVPTKSSVNGQAK